MSSEARYMLYLDVDLHRSAESHVEKWANAVASSPHLSKIIRSLCLSSTYVYPINPQGTSFHDRTLLALKGALRGAINMTEFIAREFQSTSSSNSLGFQTHCHNTIDLSIFDECRHRFKRFDAYGNIFFTGRKMVDFYAQMSNLVEWTADATITHRSTPPTMLPNLSTVYLRLSSSADIPLLNFITSRRIRRLHMDVAEFYTRADILQRARAIGVAALARRTLICLQIETDGSSSAPGESQLWQPMDVAEDIAERFTGLRFLSLVASHRNSSVSPPCTNINRNRQFF